MNSGVAYDLSRFEARPKAKAQKAPELKVVKGKAKKTAALSKVSPALLTVVAIISVFTCAYMIYTRVMITETTAAITRVNKEITTLQRAETAMCFTTLSPAADSAVIKRSPLHADFC
ncbi:MAG: hypothetical protein IIX89_01415 [Oscillospiraceae bacterium]|nr:hypothetical protein [Oscillospiraceae bacterium]